MKFVIDRFNGTISGGYDDLSGTLTNNYIVDVPLEDFYYNAPVMNVNTLLLQKYVELDKYVNNNLFNFSYRESNEFFSLPSIVAAQSTLYSTGTDRRTFIRPGGLLVLGPFTFTSFPLEAYFSSSFYGFDSGAANNGGPPRYLTYFPIPGDIGISILDNAYAVLQHIENGLITPNMALSMYSGNFYISIKNYNADKPFIVSDFCLYWKE